MGIHEEGSRRYQLIPDLHPPANQAWCSGRVTSVKHIPSALALRQRPSIPSERATVGTMSEMFNVIRLIFSTGSPSHGVTVLLNQARNCGSQSKSGEDGAVDCPVCGARSAPIVRRTLLNSAGACDNCQGTGKVRQNRRKQVNR